MNGKCVTGRSANTSDVVGDGTADDVTIAADGGGKVARSASRTAAGSCPAVGHSRYRGGSCTVQGHSTWGCGVKVKYTRVTEVGTVWPI